MMCPGCLTTLPRSTPMSCAYVDGKMRVTGTCPHCREVFYAMGGVSWTERQMNELRAALTPLRGCESILYVNDGGGFPFEAARRIGRWTGLALPEGLADQRLGDYFACAYLPQKFLAAMPSPPVEEALISLAAGAGLYALAPTYRRGFEICSRT